MTEMRLDGAEVLLVEDDPELREAIAETLALAGARVRTCADGREALRWLAGGTPDIVVTDVNMPGIDGHELLRRVRELKPQVPVLLVTAFGSVERSVQAMRDGAVDYLVKPFVVDELLARCRALLRRTTTAAPDVLRVADLELNPQSRTVRRASREIVLTKTEFDLLELLMRHPAVVVTRDQIYEEIWGYNFETSSKSLDVYVGYLRRKTEENDETRLVHTVRGVGYVVREP